MVHARRRMAMAVCLQLLCLALLLAQDAHGRKLSWVAQEKQGHGAATPEPCSSGKGGGSKGQLRCDDPLKWEEIHTDYIYTQDVKHP